MRVGEQIIRRVEMVEPRPKSKQPIVTKLEPGTQVQDLVEATGEEVKIYHCVAKLKRREKPSDVHIGIKLGVQILSTASAGTLIVNIAQTPAEAAKGEWTWQFDASPDHAIHILPTDSRLVPGGEYFISVTGHSLQPQFTRQNDQKASEKKRGGRPEKPLALALSFRIAAVHVRPVEKPQHLENDKATAAKKAAAVLSVDGTDVTKAGTTSGVRDKALDGIAELDKKLDLAARHSMAAMEKAVKARKRSEQAGEQRKAEEESRALKQVQEAAAEKERKKQERERAKAAAAAKKKHVSQRIAESAMVEDISSSNSSLDAQSEKSSQHPESESGGGSGCGSGVGEVESLSSIPESKQKSCDRDWDRDRDDGGNAYTLPTYVPGKELLRKPDAYDSRKAGKYPEGGIKASGYFDQPVEWGSYLRSSTGIHGPASVRLRKKEMHHCLARGGYAAATGSELNQRGTEAVYVSEPYHNVDARCDRLATRLRPRYRIKECLPVPGSGSGSRKAKGQGQGDGGNNATGRKNHQNYSSSIYGSAKENAGNDLNSNSKPRRPNVRRSSNGSGSVRSRLLKQVDKLTNVPAPIVEVGGVQLETPLPGTSSTSRRADSRDFAYGLGVSTTSTHAARMSAQRLRMVRDKGAAAQRLQSAREALLHIELAGFDEKRMHKERQSACLIGPSSLGGLRNLSCSTKTANRGHVRFGSSTAHR